VRFLCVVIVILLWIPEQNLLNAAEDAFFGDVIELEGSVKLYRKLRPLGVKLEQDLFHQDRIKTDKDSMLGIDVYDGTQVVVSPETKMTLTRADINKNKSINLQLLSGTIRCKVSPLKKDEIFIVRTPTATAGVRGTDFITSYSREDGFKLTVLEGKVEIIALREIEGKVRKQLMLMNEQIRLNDQFEYSSKSSINPTERQKLESELPLRQREGGGPKQNSDGRDSEASNGDDQADAGGKIRVRRLKQTIQSVTTQTQQNLFRDTINQAQRQADQAALQFQFNLVNP
jgi:hypothetical protein